MSTRTTLALVEMGRYRGDAAALSCALTHPDTGAAFTPSGKRLLFTLKRSRDLADSSALIQKDSSVGGITVANPSVVSLLRTDTASLLPRVKYHIGIRCIDDDVEVFEGVIEFENPVTRDTDLTIATTVAQPSFVRNLVPFLGSIDGLTGGTSTDLDGQVTAGTSAPLAVAVSLNDDFQIWKLRTKGGGEEEDGVSFVQPDDFHASTNNRIWVRVL